MEAQIVTQGTLQTRDGRSLPLERTEVSASVTGAVADVQVRQVFRNDSDVPIEAVYLFPLPHEASVYRMLFRIADRVVQGVVKEKAEARRAYEQARSEGRAATLLEEDKPALFTLSVANVAPGVTIEVELGYQEVVGYDDGRWRFVFPMVAPERFRDAAPSASPGGVVPPRIPTGDRAPDVSVEVMVRSEGFVESLRCGSHPVSVHETSDGVPIVRLEAGTALPNKDFVLTWKAAEEGVRPSVRFERSEGKRGTFLLMLTPSVPKDLTERAGGTGDLKAIRCGNCGGVVTDLSSIKEIPGVGPVVPCAYCGAILAPGTEVITRATRPRDVLLLVDRSASMRGSMPTVQRAVRAVLDALGPGDGAQLMAFDHDRLAFDGDGSRFAVVSPELIAMAERFLSTLAPRGGTEMEEALERMAKVPQRDGRTRVVVLITDAAVGNEGRLLRRAPEMLGTNTRLFVLGVGSAVDRRLVEKLARVCGGSSDVVLPGEGEIDETLRRFGRRVRHGGPVLTNLTMYWEGAEIVDVYPKALPDLFGGEPVRALGRFDHVGATKLIITGATADGRPFRQELPLHLPAKTEKAPGLARLWAQRRVADLAERAQAEPSNAAALKAEGTALSLEHGFVGPFTSLVAEDLQVSVTKKRVPKMRLRVIDGPHLGHGLVIEKGTVSIGRVDNENDLVLGDAAVSRKHAELTLEGDRWMLLDLGSANGTIVNHVRTPRAELRADSTITIGANTLIFEAFEGSFEALPTKRVDVPMMAPARGDAPVATAGPAPARRVKDDMTEGAADSGPFAGEDLAAAVDDSVLFSMAAPASAALADDFDAVDAPDLPREAAYEKASTAAISRPMPRAPAPAAAPAPARARHAVSAPMVAPGGPPRGGGGAPMLGGVPAPPAPAPQSFGGPPPMGGPPPGAPPASFGAPPPMMAAPAAPPFMPAMPGGPMSPAAAPPPSFGSGYAPMPAAKAPAKEKGFFSKIVDALTGEGDAAPPPPPSPMPPPLTPPVAKPPSPTPAVVVPPVMPPPPPNMPMVMPPTNIPMRPPPVTPPVTVGVPCPWCAKGNPPDIAFCLGCGAKMRPEVPQAQTSPLALPGSEPYSDEELAWFKQRNRGELDLVFLVDETGSMGSYIAQVKKHLMALVAELRASPLCRMLRLGIVTYRDHPPQDHTYASRVVPLTEDIDAVHLEVEKLQASGGGDGPESVTDGLYDLVRLDWRPTAARAVVWFGDAPPHGVEPSGDSFPNGCPCGHHWFTQAESCREMGVTVYAVGCLPGLRGFKGAEAVFKQVADTTRGIYLPLREAALLVPLIVGAASAELDRQRVDEHVADLVSEGSDGFAKTTEGERVRWITESLRAKSVRVRGMDFDPNAMTPAPMRFRPVTPADVAGSLGRLRYQGRVTA